MPSPSNEASNRRDSERPLEGIDSPITSWMGDELGEKHRRPCSCTEFTLFHPWTRYHGFLERCTLKQEMRRTKWMFNRAEWMFDQAKRIFDIRGMRRLQSNRAPDPTYVAECLGRDSEEDAAN
ncbi:hypothetical protein H2248_003476 [Termitomyces sp. 'cryptogamus']|nr:hypothetical protein H2248_003476 [Termitomyces sp. 'cryptogamus']